MVRAILDGIKTMTRRVITPQPGDKIWEHQFPSGIWGWMSNLSHKYGMSTAHLCPYGGVGDRLWVRETWYWNCVNPIESEPLEHRSSFIAYRADGEFAEQFQNWEKDDKWRPSIFMPRWASRITQEITSLRVERLQDITWEDTHKEGILRFDRDNPDPTNSGMGYNRGASGLPMRYESIAAFMDLWDSINAKRGYGWERNPWVWVISTGIVGMRLK